MKPTLEELPPRVRELLQLELEQPPMPPAVRERLGVQLAAVAVASAATPLALRALHGLAKLFSRRLPVALVSFGLGGGASVAVYASVEHHRSHDAPVSVSAAADQVPLPPAPVALAPPPPVALPPPSPEHHRVSRAPPPVAASPAPHAARDPTLAAEQTLLDIARTALTRSDSAGALEALARHSRSFPNGALAEEREALRVQALRLAGKRQEALGAMAEFKAKYPKSLSLPALEASLREGP